MLSHEAYAEVSDQVDDALSGSYHFMTWLQLCSRFCPVDPAKNLGKIRSAIGRDRAGPFSFTIGMAEATMLHHLEAEQTMWSKIKGDLLSPLVDHVNTTKRQKEAIDKKMRLLVTRIHTGKRKLAADKKSIEKDLEEYYVCLRDPDNVSNARKMPALKKKLSGTLTKYETSVKELAAIEKDYRDNIPNQMNLLHDLEKNRLKEVETRLQTLSQILFERAQDLVESRTRLESYISCLPEAQTQYDNMISKWTAKFKDTPEVPLVSYDLPVSFLNIETAHDISNINAAEEVFEQQQQKIADTQQALNSQLSKTQNMWDDDDAAELAKFNQQAQGTFQQLMKTVGNLGVRDNNNKRHARQESMRKPMAKVAPLTRTRMTVVERANVDDSNNSNNNNSGSNNEWLKLQDPATHDWYYENMFTGETTLEEPEGFVDTHAQQQSSPSNEGKNNHNSSIGFHSSPSSLSGVDEENSGNTLPFHTDGLSQEEKKKLVFEAQKLFTNGNVITEDRYFVRRGLLTKKCRSRDKDYDFFLFNDLLLWANKSGKNKFKVHKTLSIDAAFRVHDMPPKPTIKQEFAVQSVDKSFVVMVDNFTEKCGWLQDINACYQLRKNVNAGLANVEVAPVWRQDSEKDHCPQCKRNFTAFRRKHHCRKCGELGCGDCCSSRVLVRGAKPERVCQKCNPDSALAQLKKQQTSRAGVMKPPLPQNSLTGGSAQPTSSFVPLSTTTVVPITDTQTKIEDLRTTTTTTTTATTTTLSSTPAANDGDVSSPAISIKEETPISDAAQSTTSLAPVGKNGEQVSDNEVPMQYTPPVGVVWVEAVDDLSGVSYYYNTITKESTWIRPAELDSR